MPRTERQLETLDELEALAMDVTRHLHARLMATPRYDHAVFLAFDRAQRAVRRCILLSQWLAAGCPIPKPAVPRALPGTDTPRGAPTGTVRPDRVEKVERLDFGPHPETALEDGRFDEAVADLKRLLTVEPGLDRTPEAVARRLVTAEAAGHRHPPDD